MNKKEKWIKWSKIYFKWPKNILEHFSKVKMEEGGVNLEQEEDLMKRF